jgi:hypothetical protein
MRRRSALLGSCLAVVLTATACQDSATAPTTADLAPGANRALQSALPGGGVVRGQLKLPTSSARVSDVALAGRADRVINPGDYPSCAANAASSAVSAWWLKEALEFRDTERPLFTLLYVNRLADEVVLYDALYFQTEATPQYFGYNGEYTKILLKTERDIQRFFDIKSDDIQLLGMHGTMLQDSARVATVYQEVYGLPAATAAKWAGEVRQAVLASKVLDGGNHPLFSFNAFAISAPGFIPDKIIMGDGILAGYEAVGLGDVAPQAIFAHEFAHHIQYENGYFDDAVAGTTEPEKTRYTELMADAYAAYYLTHKRGATMNKKRVEQFLSVFFQIGDCGFTSGGHHGTPAQRMAAAQFGFNLADQAQKQGHILSTEEFHALFVAAYPGLIAPVVAAAR